MDVQKKTVDLAGMILVKMPVSNRNPIRTLCVTNDGKMVMNSVLLKEMKEKTNDMGHTDIAVTSNVYTHLKLEDAQAELEWLAKVEKVRKDMKKEA